MMKYTQRFVLGLVGAGSYRSLEQRSTGILGFVRNEMCMIFEASCRCTK